jgi:hypothetical protein
MGGGGRQANKGFKGVVDNTNSYFMAVLFPFRISYVRDGWNAKRQQTVTESESGRRTY